jgi:ribosomal-protein-alanine N-acetyltransferase
VRLRAIQSSDGDALHTIFTEPGVRRFLFDDAVLTREQTQAHVDAATGPHAWVICDSHGVVGFVSLRLTGEDRELMIAIAEGIWGRGLAHDAAVAAMRHGFEQLGLKRILATVDLPNGRSHKLMNRLGFMPIGESDGPKYRLRHYEALRRSGT